MKLDVERYLGAKPFLYGRDLIKRMGVKGPYVDEHQVADFLGLTVQEIDPNEHEDDFPNIGEIFDTSCAHLFRDECLILLNKNMHKTKKRTSTFHEFGHDIYIPHSAIKFSCHIKDVDQTVHQQIEREAFMAGAEIHFPLKEFVNDSSSDTLSIESIRKLSSRYVGPFEATAIRYAQTNQNVMALLVVKENESAHSIQQANGENLPMVIRSTKNPHRLSPPLLRVQYFVRSARFPKFFSSGTPIREGNLIFESWRLKTRLVGEIPARALGSSDPSHYFIECIPFDNDKRIMVLIWLPNKQREFITGVL